MSKPRKQTTRSQPKLKWWIIQEKDDVRGTWSDVVCLTAPTADAAALSYGFDGRHSYRVVYAGYSRPF